MSCHGFRNFEKDKTTSGSRPGSAEAGGLPENFPAKPFPNQNRTGISGFRRGPPPKIRPAAARLTEFPDAETILNLPHLSTSGNTHGESIMIDLVQP
jgi:hypothetical protein